MILMDSLEAISGKVGIKGVIGMFTLLLYTKLRKNKIPLLQKIMVQIL